MNTKLFRKIMMLFSIVFMAIACIKIYKGVSVTQSITAIVFGLLTIISTFIPVD